MIITGIETVPLRIPFKAGTKSDASAWGDSNLPAADVDALESEAAPR
jgi:hypothetical protein